MSERWTQFLEDQGISTGFDGFSHTQGEDVDAFQKLSGDTICDLNHTVRVLASGDDAESFLQSQITNDLRALGNDQAMLAGYCDAKGRLICIFRIERRADGFALELPRDIRDAAIQSLSKYVLRARVTFADDEHAVAFGVCGRTAAKRLEQLAGPLPRRDGKIHRVDDDKLSIARVPGDGRPRFRIVAAERAGVSVWEKLRQHVHVMGSWAWARLDILAGIPTITTDTSGLFIPQMVNLDLLGGVNFQKGCYPGQEIVARMHYLGKLKQRMSRFRVDTDTRPKPGDRIFSRGAESPTGTVVDAQRGAGSGWDLLAVIRLEGGPFCLQSAEGPVLFEEGLPYSVNSDS